MEKTLNDRNIVFRRKRMMRKEGSNLAGNNCIRDKNGRILFAEDGRKRVWLEFCIDKCAKTKLRKTSRQQTLAILIVVYSFEILDWNLSGTKKLYTKIRKIPQSIQRTNRNAGLITLPEVLVQMELWHYNINAASACDTDCNWSPWK